MLILPGLLPFVLVFFVLAGGATALSLAALTFTLVHFFGRNRTIRLRTGQPLLGYYGRLASSH